MTSELTVYGAMWCSDCRRVKALLEERHIPHRWVDTQQSREGRAVVEQLNRGSYRVPTLVFGDGSVLTEPSDSELLAKMGMTERVPESL